MAVRLPSRLRQATAGKRTSIELAAFRQFHLTTLGPGHTDIGMPGFTACNAIQELQPPGVLLQFCEGACQHFIPIAAFFLVENPHARIPRRVSMITHPAPAASMPIEQPYALAHCVSEMGYGCADTDHEIQRCDERGRIGEILYLIDPVDDMSTLPA